MKIGADALGSIRLLVHESGAIAESYAYDVYGRPRVMAGAGPDGNWLTEDTTTYTASAVGNPYLFTARRWDADTSLYHYRHRDYTPTLGRFLQTDPLGYIDGLNLYAYVNNNPLNWIDPWGLFRFGYRPLDDYDPLLPHASWFAGVIIGGPAGSLALRGTLNYLNIEVYHEAGFYEDGSGDVADFSGSGRNEDRSRYFMRGRHYNDDLMRQAQKNVDEWFRKKAHDRWIHNCQHYCSALRKEYRRLEKEQKRQEREQRRQESQKEDCKK